MAVQFFEARRGVSLGGDAQFITGSGDPGGSGDPDVVAKGSLYLDNTGGALWLKDTAGTGADKWVRIQNQDDIDGLANGISWREPSVVKDETAYANLAAAETVLNTSPYEIDGIVMAEGSRILFDGITGSDKNIYKVVGTPGSGATLVETEVPATDPTDGDITYIQQGTYAGFRFVYNGTDWIQQGSTSNDELGWIRDFIGKDGEGNESTGYSSQNIVTDGDTLESGIGSLDAEIGDAVSGAASRTVGPVSDQDVNSNIEALDTAIGADVTSTDVVATSDSVNGAISKLDAEIGEGIATAQARTVGPISDQEVNDNIEQLDDAIGPDTTSNLITSTANSVNANLDALDAIADAAHDQASADSVTAATTIQSVNVDAVLMTQWLVHVRSVATPANVNTVVITATHDGHSAADATTVDFNQFAKLKIGGAISGLTFDVDLNGSGAAQVMRLRVSCSTAVHVRCTRENLEEV